MSDWQRNKELDGKPAGNSTAQTASLVGFDDERRSGDIDGAQRHPVGR